MAGRNTNQKFCYKCGAELHAGSTYCRVCGYRQVTQGRGLGKKADSS